VSLTRQSRTHLWRFSPRTEWNPSCWKVWSSLTDKFVLLLAYAPQEAGCVGGENLTNEGN